MTSLLWRRRGADSGEDAKCEARNRDVKVKCQRGLLKLNCLKFGCVSGRRGDDAPLSLSSLSESSWRSDSVQTLGTAQPGPVGVYITQHGRRCCETMQDGEGKEEREGNHRHQSEGCMNITGSDSTCTFFICMHAGSSLSPSVM